jgi:hypothetical protein
MKQYALRGLGLSLLFLAACSDSGTTPGETSSFDRIQATVFDNQCVSCHRAGTAFATQSGLILEAGQAYENLVNAHPTNASARTEGLRRVVPFNAAGSLLYHKLSWAIGHHAANYGAPMPLGGQSLYTGEIEFIRRWIEAGAPRTGSPVDVTLLDDRTRPIVEPFVPLALPARGYQLRIEPFTIKPQFERELFVARRVGNTQDVFVNRIETRMRTNSHHLLLHTFDPGIPSAVRPQPGVIRDIRNPDGTLHTGNILTMGYHIFFGGAMTPRSDYRMPDGVAIRLPANAMLDMNSHYVNKTNGELIGEAYANLHTVDATQVKHVARTLNLANFNLTLPANRRTTITSSFTAGADNFPVGSDGTVKLVTLTSHMHARGEKFVIRIKGGARDGEVIYTNTDWASPLVATFTPALVLQRGAGLTSEVTYNNDTSRTIRFGLLSEDEMNIIFGYSY